MGEETKLRCGRDHVRVFDLKQRPDHTWSELPGVLSEHHQRQLDTYFTNMKKYGSEEEILATFRLKHNVSKPPPFLTILTEAGRTW